MKHFYKIVVFLRFFFVLACVSCTLPVHTQDLPASPAQLEGCSYGIGLPAGRGNFVFHFPSLNHPVSAAPTYAGDLQRIASIVSRDGGNILISSHRDASDPIGADARWAEAVASGLRAQGVHPNRIWVQVRGASEPLVPNAVGQDNIVANRRVEVLPTNWGSVCRRQYSSMMQQWLRNRCSNNNARAMAGECEAVWNRLSGQGGMQ